MRVVLAVLLACVLQAQVKIAPYYAIALGTQTVVTVNGTTSIDYVASGSMNRGKVPYAARAVSLSIPIPASFPAVTAVYFATWTCSSFGAASPTGNPCNAVNLDTYTASMSGSSIVAGQVNTFTPATPLAALKYDYVGVRFEFASQSAGVPLLSYTQYAANSTAGGNTTSNETSYYQLSQTKPTALTFASMTLVPNNGLAPIGFNAPSGPVILGTGDSWFDGSGGWCSTQSVWLYAQSTPNCPPTGAMAGDYPATSPTYMDGGFSGQTSANILARFSADVIGLHPTYVISEGYINDLVACGSGGCSGGQISATEANLAAEWAALQTAGIASRSLFLLAGPWGAGTNAQMLNKDTLDAYAIATAPAYGLRVIDVRCQLGVFRSGGSGGNCWNWNATYEQSDGLQIHPNIAGNAIISAAAYALLPYISGNTASSNSNGGVF